MLLKVWMDDVNILHNLQEGLLEMASIDDCGLKALGEAIGRDALPSLRLLDVLAEY